MFLMSMEYKPLITIIVPIYNGELFLKKCMDSLVYQTLENIEIIAVDNGSDDNTRALLDEYASRFPEKVTVGTIEHTNGPGGGRNYGLKRARADYIIFADCDDYFDYFAMEILYKKMISDDYDMVYCANYDVKNNILKKTRVLNNTDVDYVLRNGSMVFWNKLVKKELFERLGPVPEDIVFEDIAYVSSLICNSKKIGYVDTPLYYYVLRDDSGVNDLHSDRVTHSLKAYDFALQKCSDAFKENLIASIAHRICFDLKKARWTFADYFIKYIKDNRELFDVDKVKQDKDTYGMLQFIDTLIDEPIPQNIFINGFGNIDNEYIEYVKTNAFWGKTKVIVLNEDNCNVFNNRIIKEAYERKDYDFVSSYFALKKIYECGGIYISKEVEILNYFNCLRYYKSFFGYLDKNSLSDFVYGGVKNSQVFKDLVNTYEMSGVYSSVDFRLSERMKGLFTANYKIHLDGNYYSNDDMIILPSTILSTNLRGDQNICRINFRGCECKEGYIVLKESMLKDLLG